MILRLLSTNNFSLNIYHLWSNKLLEYLVIDVMNEDVQDIEDDLVDLSLYTPYADWVSFLEKIHPNVDPQQLLAMRLGSELHTFPADASRELTIDKLTRRLDALRDW